MKDPHLSDAEVQLPGKAPNVQPTDTQELAESGAAMAEMLLAEQERPERQGAEQTFEVGSLLGEILALDERSGRAEFCWSNPELGGGRCARWLPAMMGLSLRVGDRVMVTRPANDEQWVIVGVLDGFSRRAPVPLESAADMKLGFDQKIRVCAADGHPLFEVSQNEGAAILNVLSEDLELRTPGHLRIAAASLAFEANKGKVQIKASDDVKVVGEAIHLN